MVEFEIWVLGLVKSQNLPPAPPLLLDHRQSLAKVSSLSIFWLLYSWFTGRRRPKSANKQSENWLTWHFCQGLIIVSPFSLDLSQHHGNYRRNPLRPCSIFPWCQELSCEVGGLMCGRGVQFGMMDAAAAAAASPPPKVLVFPHSRQLRSFPPILWLDLYLYFISGSVSYWGSGTYL